MLMYAHFFNRSFLSVSPMHDTHELAQQAARQTPGVTKHQVVFGWEKSSFGKAGYRPPSACEASKSLRQCFDIEKEQWKQVAPKNSPKGRYGHSAIVTPSGQMWIYGGARINLETGVNEHLGFSDNIA